MRVRATADEQWRWVDPAARRGLPLRTLLRLYLDPFSLSRPVPALADPIARAAALRHNHRLATQFLPRYLARWLVLHGLSWAGVTASALIQTAGAQAAFASLFGVGVASSFCVMVVAAAAWLLLHARASR